MEPNLILKDIRAGQEESFKRLFHRFYSQLVGYAQNYLFDKAESESIVQEVFIHLWKNADRIEIRVSLKAYLYAMVRNRCLNYLRTLRITDDYQTIDHLAEMEPENDIEIRSMQNYKYEKILEIIESFPERMRTIFKMKYLSNYSYNKIASELNISVNTVKTQLRRAKQRLNLSFPQIIIFFYFIFC